MFIIIYFTCFQVPVLILTSSLITLKSSFFTSLIINHSYKQ